MIPTFSPQHTERIAKRLLYGRPKKSEPGLLEQWVGKDLVLQLDAQAEFIRHVRQLLGFSIPEESLKSSCSCVFVRSTITHELLTFWAWHLAANRDGLRRGCSLSSWNGIVGKLWAPVEIIHAKRGRSPRDRCGVILTFRIIDGPACPVTFERWFPDRFLWIMAKELGLSWRRQKRSRFTGNPPEYVGMRLSVNLKPRCRTDGNPTNNFAFERYRGGQFMAFNQRLMRERAKPCPAGYTWECVQCSLGRDYCPANKPQSLSRACRPVSLWFLPCATCGKDTLHDRGECVICRKKNPPQVKILLTPLHYAIPRHPKNQSSTR